jgi:uncharacterized membrane protein
MLLLSPLLGAAVGTASGILAARLIDIGIDDHFMKELAATFTPGSAALFVLVRRASREKVLGELKPFAGRTKLLQTTLTKDKEDELRRFVEGKREATALKTT